jgi:hypothetical protein
MSSIETTPKFAAITDIEKWEEQAKVAWIQCRRKGHNMLDHDVKVDEESNCYIVVERCSRCFTKRDEVVNRDTGAVLHSKYYNHPDGYLLPKGTGRMGADARGLIRVASLRNSHERKRDLTELTSSRSRKAR